MKRSIIVLATILSLSTISVAFAAMKKAGDKQVKENVVATQLIGEWEFDADINKMLGLEPKATALNATVRFVEDPRVVDNIPEKYTKGFLNDKAVYLSGRMKNGQEDWPFILIEHNGNPHVIIFLPSQGDPYGTGESFNLMMARGADKSCDRLFIGGDFNNQHFTAFKRVDQTE